MCVMQLVHLCREEFAGVVMERVASEFNRLQYNVSLTSAHPLVEGLTPVSLPPMESLPQLLLLSPVLSLTTHSTLFSMHFSYYYPHFPLHTHMHTLTQRIAVITSTLQEWLEMSFRAGLEGGHREALTRTLQTYATIGRQQAAQSMFQSLIVHPYMEKVERTPTAWITVALCNHVLVYFRWCRPRLC